MPDPRWGMMRTEGDTRNGIRSSSHFCLDNNEPDLLLLDQKQALSDTDTNDSTISSPNLLPISSSSSSLSSSVSTFIEHRVSKFDTLAGVAIKYGVEVADIKKMNGLVMDLQMFALQSLQIPLPGRHPPSPCISNVSYTPGQSSSELTPPPCVNRDLLDSFQSLKMNSFKKRVSPAMSSLQGYYKLEPTDYTAKSEGFEMAVYGKETARPSLKLSLNSNQPRWLDRKSRSVTNGFIGQNGELADMSAAEKIDIDKSNEKLVRRRQKSEADFTSQRPKKIPIEENSSNGFFSTLFGKRLNPRPKSASRTATPYDAEAGGLNPIPLDLGDSLVADGSGVVRKSSSTPSLQDQESSTSSIWSTSKWNLKPDLQALSTVSITRPFFDGLPKPGRKSKAALD